MNTQMEDAYRRFHIDYTSVVRALRSGEPLSVDLILSALEHRPPETKEERLKRARRVYAVYSYILKNDKAFINLEFMGKSGDSVYLQERLLFTLWVFTAVSSDEEPKLDFVIDELLKHEKN